MKVAFIIPILSDCNIDQKYEAIQSACKETEVDYEIIFAFNDKLNNMFSKVRSTFIDNQRVKAFQVNKTVNQHKLVTIAMKCCEHYDSVVVYSGKEVVNEDVVKAFITSWKAGNKVVYLKKVFSGFKKLWTAIKNGVYWLGTKLMGVYKDLGAETDIQLFDKDVVITINQLPEKNRHLRTLDSFVGYNTDIIKMEVDGKIKDSKYYVEKTKKFKVADALSWLFLTISLVLITFAVLSLVLHWRLRMIVNLILWVGSIIFVMFALVYYTKKTLLLRVGDSEDMSDLDEIINKMEKYNF